MIPETGTKSGDSLDETMNHLDERIDRLSDEIGAIQVQLADKHKPWYRQSALLVSIGALLFTIGNTLWTRSSDTTAKGNERLQTIVSQLSEIRTEEAKDLLTAKADFSAYATRASLRNTKRIALLEDADTALAQVRGEAPSAIYVALGFEAATQGNYKKADQFYAKGVDRAGPHTYERMWAEFDRALLRLVPDTPFYNLSEGRKLYSEAVTELAANDDNTRYQRGQVLARIGQIETQLHEPVRAREYLARAAEEVQKMNPLNGLRDLLNQEMLAASQANIVVRDPLTLAFSKVGTWSGEWKLRFLSNKDFQGKITFAAGSVPTSMVAFVDIAQDGRLIEKQLGQVTVLDDQHLRIDWNAQRSLPVPSQTAGYMLLAIALPSSRITGEIHAFSEAPVPVELSRALADRRLAPRQ